MCDIAGIAAGYAVYIFIHLRLQSLVAMVSFFWGGGGENRTEDKLCGTFFRWMKNCETLKRQFQFGDTVLLLLTSIVLNRCG